MREIKFRAWDKINKKMEEVDGYNLYIADGRMFEIYEASYAYETYMRKNDVTDKYILMQYTGLKDKNGWEIYEGDIVLVWDHKQPAIVEYDEGCFYTPIGISRYRLGWWQIDAIEVIGNIYENPELLKGDKFK